MQAVSYFANEPETSRPDAAGSADAVAALDAAGIRRRFASAFKPSPLIFWSDLLASALVGWAAFFGALSFEFGSLAHVGLTLVATFGLLRGALFIHELSHVKRGGLPGFELGWHALIGVPLLLPSLMYVGSHTDHHRRATFATAKDPEYAPLAKWSHLQLVRFVLGVVIVPVALPLRWAVMAPVSYLVRPLRVLVVERLSTLVINPDYRRPMPDGDSARRWAIQEAACGTFAWLVAAAVFSGLIPLVVLWQYWIVGAGILLVNQVRTLAAHGYQNEGVEVDTMSQFLDSTNIQGIPVLTPLMAPVGLRYHALHHFLPSVPYHSLGALHRQLSAELSPESGYHRAERRGILPVLRDLWRQSPA